MKRIAISQTNEPSIAFFTTDPSVHWIPTLSLARFLNKKHNFRRQRNFHILLTVNRYPIRARIDNIMSKCQHEFCFHGGKRMTTSPEISINSSAGQVATRIATYTVKSGKDAEFQAWQKLINEKCGQFPGFIGIDAHPPSVNESNNEWVIVYRFQNAATLKSWLESSERTQALAAAPDIFIKKRSEYTLSGGGSPDSSVTIVTAHKVIPGQEAAHEAANKALNDAAARFPGFAGCEIFKPTPDNNEYTTLIRFNNKENMNRWLNSPERKAGREVLYRTTADHRTKVVATGFGSWFAFNAEDGIAAAAWKQAMVVLSALFPVVMIVNMTVGNFLSNEGASFAVNVFVGNTVGTIILTWLVMPVISRMMNWWLSPRSTSKQAGIGFVFLLILYVIEIYIFQKI